MKTNPFLTLILSLTFFIVVFSHTYSMGQNAITSEEYVFYNHRVYNSYLLDGNPLAPFILNGKLFLDLRSKTAGVTKWCISWYDAWLFENYYNQFMQSSKDEFEMQSFVNSKTSEFINKYNNVNFNKLFLYSSSTEFSGYDFINKGFYISIDKALPYPLFNWETISFKDIFISMDEVTAKAFLQKRKDVNGVPNRQLLVNTTYSIMNIPRSDTKFTYYLHNVTIYDGAKVLKVIKPTINYFDKIFGVKLNNGIEKEYFDLDGKKLNKSDSLRAAFTNIIEYKDGKILNPLINGFYSGNYREGYYYTPSGGSLIKVNCQGDILTIEGMTYVNGWKGEPFKDVFTRSLKYPSFYICNNDSSLNFYILNETSFVFTLLGTQEPYVRYLQDYIHQKKWNVEEKNVSSSGNNVKLNEQALTISEPNPSIRTSNSPKTVERIPHKIAPKITTSIIGYFNDNFSTGDYKCLFDQGYYYSKKSEFLKNIFYKANSIDFTSISFGDSISHENKDIVVKQGEDLLLNLNTRGIALFTVGITGPTKAKYSWAVQIEDSNGKEYYSEKENKDFVRKDNTGLIINIPIEIKKEKLRLIPTSQDLILSFLIKDRFIIENVIQGFIKFKLEK